MQSVRYEIPLSKEDHSYYQIESLQENGLILHRRINGIEEDQMEFIRLDTAFQELWKGYLTYENP
ncbi:MAG: hypothetical protein HC811_04520 [Flammeovirgaceae bacterium]|nr:hypothetical protein [Flammeovirgaceae bacterium]